MIIFSDKNKKPNYKQERNAEIRDWLHTSYLVTEVTTVLEFYNCTQMHHLHYQPKLDPLSTPLISECNLPSTVTESPHFQVSIATHSCCKLNIHICWCPFLPVLKEQLGLGCRTLFGLEASQMSFLFFLVYAAAAGGLLPLLESSPGSAQELKVKVSLATFAQVYNKTKVPDCPSALLPSYLSDEIKLRP